MLQHVGDVLASYRPRRIEGAGCSAPSCYHEPAMKFTVILEPEADGGYSVVCPAIPGCVSQGDSLDDAITNIRKAILLCLEVRGEDGMPVPVETPEIIAREIQECLEDRAEEGLPLSIETREVSLAGRLDSSLRSE